jgi:hypothetical protein
MDVLLIVGEWRPRTLLRAQLAEEGREVLDLGFARVMARPFSVRDVVEVVARIAGGPHERQAGGGAGEGSP